jgi:hypothetical protein
VRTRVGVERAILFTGSGAAAWGSVKLFFSGYAPALPGMLAVLSLIVLVQAFMTNDKSADESQAKPSLEGFWGGALVNVLSVIGKLLIALSLLGCRHAALHGDSLSDYVFAFVALWLSMAMSRSPLGVTGHLLEMIFSRNADGDAWNSDRNPIRPRLAVFLRALLVFGVTFGIFRFGAVFDEKLPTSAYWLALVVALFSSRLLSEEEIMQESAEDERWAA